MSGFLLGELKLIVGESKFMHKNGVETLHKRSWNAEWNSKDINRRRLGPFQPSQAARQGLAVLMASASVVLKHKTSTLRQRHNFISIDLKFSVSDYVREVTSPAKFGSDSISGQDATWGQHIRVLRLFFSFFVLVFYSSTELQPKIPWTNFRAQ